MESEQGKEEQRSRQREDQLSHQQGRAFDEQAASEHERNYRASMLAGSGLSGRGNMAARASLMQTMQQTHGNRAVQRFIQRSKDTSMPAVQRETDNDSWWDEITKSLYQDDEGTYQMPQDDIKDSPPAPEPKPWDPSQGPPPGFTPYDPNEVPALPPPPPIPGWYPPPGGAPEPIPYPHPPPGFTPYDPNEPVPVPEPPPGGWPKPPEGWPVEVIEY